MALGRTQTQSIIHDVIDIDLSRTNIDDCINTFQYVVKSLSEWADETTIGNELRSELVTLVETVENLNEKTGQLMQTVNEFAARQERINNN